MSSSPTEIIIDVHNNDIIGGRGSLPLRHPGNISYRKIVNSNKQAYIKSMKNDKLRLSKSIVAAIRETGGRFLERVSPYNKDEDGSAPIAYRDIGDRRAIEKTSQALREGQPKLKRQMIAIENEKKAVSPLSSPSLLNTNTNLPSAIATTPLASLSTEHLLRLALSNVQSRSSTNHVKVERVSPPPLARNVTEEQHLPLPLPSYMQNLDADLLLIHLLRRANRSEQSILL